MTPQDRVLGARPDEAPIGPWNARPRIAGGALQCVVKRGASARIEHSDPPRLTDRTPAWYHPVMLTCAYLIEPPFNHRMADGSITGCDVVLARTVVRAAGLGELRFVETEFAELLPGLAARRWDMTTGLFATDERRLAASFSRPIWALPDGLLVSGGNPLRLSGYRSAAEMSECILAVVRNQFQHRSAVAFGVPPDRIRIFETYEEAARAVAEKRADAYASVAKAHQGYLKAAPHLDLSIVSVPTAEKPPAFGAFAFALSADVLRSKVDDALTAFLGTSAHRAMMKRFGFDNSEVDLVADLQIGDTDRRPV